MTSKNRTRHQIRNIRSLRDLKAEKTRLREEALRLEEKIDGNYKDILSAFTLKSIIQRLTNELSMTSTVVSTAFSLGKSLISKFKKKKKNKDKGDNPVAHTSPQDNESTVEK